jgi:hypothetical protein
MGDQAADDLISRLVGIDHGEIELTNFQLPSLSRYLVLGRNLNLPRVPFFVKMVANIINPYGGTA